MGSYEFPVIVKRREVVAPAVVPLMQKHWLPMSNLDLLLPPLDVGVFFCYKRKPSESEENMTMMVSVVRKALAQALVSFHAFAGEVVPNRLGEPELLCNNRGVDFVHACADIDLKHLDLYHPDSSVHGKLVPIKEHGVLSVQVTELRCGGLVIGCTFDHRVADAHSANMFFVAWAEMAQAKAISHVPCFRRSLLNPRRPGRHDPSIDDIYVLLSSLPPPPKVHPDEPSSDDVDVVDDDDDDHLISRIYYVTAEEIDGLQSQVSGSNYDNGGGGGGPKLRSKLESFSAFLWKMIIAEGGKDQSKRCKMGIVIDGRERLKAAAGTGTESESMQNYFGNVLSIPYAEASVGELKAMSLGMVADALHECLEGTAKEEHFLGLIDWVELHRPEPAIVKVYCKLESTEEAAVVVSSGQRFPVSKIDFGWGQPAFGSYHFPWGGQTGYVMPMPSPTRDGDWIVYMHLLRKHLDLVETKAAHVFRPLTPTYLNLI